MKPFVENIQTEDSWGFYEYDGVCYFAIYLGTYMHAYRHTYILTYLDTDILKSHVPVLK